MNGVARRGDYLYVNDCFAKTINKYKINDDKTLEKVDSYYIGQNVDNIWLHEETNSLLVAVMPRFIDVYNYFGNKAEGKDSKAHGGAIEIDE